MKKFLRTLMLLVFVVPVILVMTACESGPVTPPNYEIREGDYEFDEYWGYRIQTEADGYNAYFSRTSDDLEDIIYDYLVRLDDEYYYELDGDDYYDYGNEISQMDSDAEYEISAAVELFINEQIFTLSVPDTTDMYSGIMTVDDEYNSQIFDLDVTVNPNRSGKMTVRDPYDEYDASAISYEYVDGTITVTIDVAQIIYDIAVRLDIDNTYDEFIPALWVQFDLN